MENSLLGWVVGPALRLSISSLFFKGLHVVHGLFRLEPAEDSKRFNGAGRNGCQYCVFKRRKQISPSAPCTMWRWSTVGFRSIRTHPILVASPAINALSAGPWFTRRGGPMRDIHSDRSPKHRAFRSTSFPAVPIKDVPVPGSSADTSADRPLVLVVRDQPDVADALSEILNRNGFAAVAVYDGEDALETALLIPPDLVIADVALPGMSGIEMATVLKAELPDCKVLLLSGEETAPDRLASAKSVGHGLDLVNTPANPIDLLTLVSSSLKLR